MFDRKLLTKLSRCAWKVLSWYLTQAIPYDDAKAGAAVAVQSFGDFQNFHPHLHILCTDGCFYDDDAFMVEVHQASFCRLPDPVLIDPGRAYRFGLHLLDYTNLCPTEVELVFQIRTDLGMDARSVLV